MLDQLLQTIILGLIQGTSEWLPISSTAHLKLTEHYFGLAVTPLFNVVLHAGTLAVVVFFFRKEVRNIFTALMHLDFKSESGTLIPHIILATIPTAIIGITYSLYLQDSMQTIPIIAITLLVGGTIVYITKYAKEDENGLSYKIVILIGLAQGFAIFPGLSRSGVTISTALILGLKRQKAFKFSFLLSIPAILGDLIFEAYNQRGLISSSGINFLEMLAGIAAAVLAGYFALKLVSRVIQGKKFHFFAFYTWALGIALLILTFFVH